MRPCAALALCAAFALGGVSSAGTPPQPAEGLELDPRPCKYEGNDPFEKRFYRIEGWKGPDFDALPGPLPAASLRLRPDPRQAGPERRLRRAGHASRSRMRDGYITRFKPDLVRADGTRPADRADPPPPRHLALGPRLRQRPVLRRRRGEDRSPRSRSGYGMPVKATDQWLLLYMVHSAVQQPMEVYITYDIDFVPKAEGRGDRAQAGLSGLARRPPLRLPGLQRPARLRRPRRQVHLAEAAAAPPSTRRQADRRPGRCRATAGAPT